MRIVALQAQHAAMPILYNAHAWALRVDVCFINMHTS
jgi:hypothetical protein